MSQFTNKLVATANLFFQCTISRINGSNEKELDGMFARFARARDAPRDSPERDTREYSRRNLPGELSLAQIIRSKR